MNAANRWLVPAFMKQSVWSSDLPAENPGQVGAVTNSFSYTPAVRNGCRFLPFQGDFSCILLFLTGNFYFFLEAGLAFAYNRKQAHRVLCAAHLPRFRKECSFSGCIAGVQSHSFLSWEHTAAGTLFYSFVFSFPPLFPVSL